MEPEILPVCSNVVESSTDFFVDLTTTFFYKTRRQQQSNRRDFQVRVPPWFPKSFAFKKRRHAEDAKCRTDCNVLLVQTFSYWIPNVGRGNRNPKQHVDKSEHASVTIGFCRRATRRAATIRLRFSIAAGRESRVGRKLACHETESQHGGEDSQQLPTGGERFSKLVRSSKTNGSEPIKPSQKGRNINRHPGKAEGTE